MYSSTPAAPGRRGMTMVEVAAAAALLAVLLASAVQVVRVLDLQQRATARRTLALETAQALLEQLANTPYAELTPAAAAALQVPDAVKPHLPGATLAATVTEESNPIPAKRVTIELGWNTASDAAGAPVRLTTWTYERD